MQQYDLVGVGIGPFNLSLAALLSNVPALRSCFFDKSEQFIWHPGMLFSDATLQVSHLYDLVTLVDPTNKYSFLSYLAAHKRLYRFANANFSRVLRKEYSDYFSWVSRQLANMHFNENVNNVSYENQRFTINTSHQSVKSKHLVLGAGLSAYVPAFAKPYLGNTVYHCNQFLSQSRNWHNKRLLVVGGGQSGAEIFHQILSDDNNLPTEITWISRRNSFLPMDESPFTNELYTPPHTESFYQLSSDKKRSMLQDHLLSSDGISFDLLQSIYQRLYSLQHLTETKPQIKLLPRHELSSMPYGSKQMRITNIHSRQNFTMDADIIIFCTGFQWQLPDFIATIKDQIKFDAQGKFIVNDDFSIAWDGAESNKIYVQNAARHTHGVQDPNLCLAAWRSAKIINSMSGKQIYDINNDDMAIDWEDIYNNKQGRLNMLAISDINSPKVDFLPVKMVYETIRVVEPDFLNRQNKPPFEVIYFQIEPGDSTPKDRHEDVEIWIVLSGNGKLIYDEQEVLLNPHDMAHFAPNKFHQVFNVGHQPLLICSLAWLI